MQKLVVNCLTGVSELVEMSADEIAAQEADRAARVEPERAAAQVFDLPLVAPDFIVASPQVKADPLEALAEAVAEASKAHGEKKSIALITLSLARYLDDVERRLKKAKI